MKSILRLAALAAAFAPASALAHPGEHGHVEEGLLAHLLESPFHVGIAALALALVGYGAVRTLLPARRKIDRD